MKCIGCNIIFVTGAALIRHIHSNKCRDPRGQMREKTLRENRVTAALCLEQLAHSSSISGAWQSQTDSIDGESSAGGVPIQVSLLDSDVPSNEPKAPEKSLLDDDLSDFDDVASMATIRSDHRIINEANFPPLGASDAKAKTNKTVVEGRDSLGVSASEAKESQVGGKSTKWEKVNGKPGASTDTPSRSIWTNTTPRSVSNESGFRGKTDWDHLKFEKDKHTGEWVCPFDNCS